MGSFVSAEMCMTEDEKTKTIDVQLNEHKKEIRSLKEEYATLKAQYSKSSNDAEYAVRERGLVQERKDIIKLKEKFVEQNNRLQREADQCLAEIDDLEKRLR